MRPDIEHSDWGESKDNAVCFPDDDERYQLFTEASNNTVAKPEDKGSSMVVFTDPWLEKRGEGGTKEHTEENDKLLVAVEAKDTWQSEPSRQRSVTLKDIPECSLSVRQVCQLLPEAAPFVKGKNIHSVSLVDTKAGRRVVVLAGDEFEIEMAGTKLCCDKKVTATVTESDDGTLTMDGIKGINASDGPSVYKIVLRHQPPALEVTGGYRLMKETIVVPVDKEFHKRCTEFFTALKDLTETTDVRVCDDVRKSAGVEESQGSQYLAAAVMATLGLKFARAWAKDVLADLHLIDEGNNADNRSIASPKGAASSEKELLGKFTVVEADHLRAQNGLEDKSTDKTRPVKDLDVLRQEHIDLEMQRSSIKERIALLSRSETEKHQQLANSKPINQQAQTTGDHAGNSNEVLRLGLDLLTVQRKLDENWQDRKRSLEFQLDKLKVGLREQMPALQAEMQAQRQRQGQALDQMSKDETSLYDKRQAARELGDKEGEQDLGERITQTLAENKELRKLLDRERQNLLWINQAAKRILGSDTSPNTIGQVTPAQDAMARVLQNRFLPSAVEATNKQPASVHIQKILTEARPLQIGLQEMQGLLPETLGQFSQFLLKSKFNSLLVDVGPGVPAAPVGALFDYLNKSAITPAEMQLFSDPGKEYRGMAHGGKWDVVEMNFAFGDNWRVTLNHELGHILAFRLSGNRELNQLIDAVYKKNLNGTSVAPLIKEILHETDAIMPPELKDPENESPAVKKLTDGERRTGYYHSKNEVLAEAFALFVAQKEIQQVSKQSVSFDRLLDKVCGSSPPRRAAMAQFEGMYDALCQHMFEPIYQREMAKRNLTQIQRLSSPGSQMDLHMGTRSGSGQVRQGNPAAVGSEAISTGQSKPESSPTKGASEPPWVRQFPGDIEVGLKFGPGTSQSEVIAAANGVFLVDDGGHDARSEPVVIKEPLMSIKAGDKTFYYRTGDTDVYEKTGADQYARIDKYTVNTAEQIKFSLMLDWVTEPFRERHATPATEANKEIGRHQVFARTIGDDFRLYAVDGQQVNLKSTDPIGIPHWFGYDFRDAEGELLKSSSLVKVHVFTADCTDVARVQAELIPELIRACKKGGALAGKVASFKTHDPLFGVVDDWQSKTPWQEEGKGPFMPAANGQRAKGFTIYPVDARYAEEVQIYLGKFLADRGLRFDEPPKTGNVGDSFVDANSRRVSLELSQLPLATLTDGTHGGIVEPTLSQSIADYAVKQATGKATGWEKFQTRDSLFEISHGESVLKAEALQKILAECHIDPSVCRLEYGANSDGKPRLVFVSTHGKHHLKDSYYLDEASATRQLKFSPEGVLTKGLSGRPAYYEMALVVGSALGRHIDPAKPAKSEPGTATMYWSNIVANAAKALKGVDLNHENAELIADALESEVKTHAGKVPADVLTEWRRAIAQVGKGDQVSIDKIFGRSGQAAGNPAVSAVQPKNEPVRPASVLEPPGGVETSTGIGYVPKNTPGWNEKPGARERLPEAFTIGQGKDGKLRFEAAPGGSVTLAEFKSELERLEEYVENLKRSGYTDTVKELAELVQEYKLLPPEKRLDYARKLFVQLTDTAAAAKGTEGHKPSAGGGKYTKALSVIVGVLALKQGTSGKP